MRQRKQTKGQRDRNVVVFRRAHKIGVPNHPTEIVSQPWNSLVLRMNNPTGIVDHGTLYNAITTQLSGISFTASVLNVRISRVHLWGPIPITPTPLVVRFYDLFDEVAGSTPAGNLVVEEVTDYPDAVNRARVGYEWSTAQQQKSLLVTAGSNDRLLWVNSGGGAGSVMYVYLLWRPFPQGVPPSVDKPRPSPVDGEDYVRIAPENSRFLRTESYR